MKCPNCGGNMGLEDAFCPYCNTPNAMAAQHQSDMARYQQEYQRTQADVMAQTSLMQRHGSWLVILAILLAALVVGVILNVAAWDIGYGIREKNVERSFVEDRQAMDAYLDAGDYGKFLGYYDANDISVDYNNPYQALHMAARSYVDLLEYVSNLHDSSYYAFKPEYLSDTCGYIAEDMNRIFTLEQQYSYNTAGDGLPYEKRVYAEDIRERTAMIAKAYFGLTDEQIQDIPNMSTSRLAQLIEEGIQQ